MDNGGKRRQYKIILVGDGMVGKTCLLYSYSNQSFMEECPPTLIDNFAVDVTINGIPFSLVLVDTNGQEDYEHLRTLSYPNTDCFLLCFAIDSHSSFANVEQKWLPELRLHCPTAAIILVGTKGDLRSEKGPKDCISPIDASKLKVKIRASSFVECSAKTHRNVHHAFEEAIKAVIQVQHESKRRTANNKNCAIL